MMTTAIPESTRELRDTGGGGQPPPPRRRRRLLAAGSMVAVAAAAGVAIAVSDPFSGSGHAAVAHSSAKAISLATVKRGTLSQQVDASGTLGYVAQADGSPYDVVNQASGTFTWLPASGKTIACGKVLYRVANKPVALLCGPVPAYRALSEGDSGPDVKELNAQLVKLGYAPRSELDPTSDYFSSETAAALERLQDKLGVDQTGTLGLGQAVFQPGPLRIDKVTASLGSAAHPGSPVAQATSTRRQVQVQLDASEQSSVKVGERALVTLPDNKTTPGTVSRIGTVASSQGSGSSSDDSGSSGSSGSSGATIPVYITLKDPRAAGSLDQAPVQVQISSSGIKGALIVPVNALLAQPGGRYAVQVAGAQGVDRLVPITVGEFDDADGLVQVTGSKLSPGDKVVVPGT